MGTQLAICEVPAAFDVKHWKLIGKHLTEAKTVLLWDLGDWLIEGEYGLEGEELKELATKITGYSWGNLKNYMWVSRSFPKSRRRDKLTYSHHREVAKKEFDEVTQDNLLDSAIKGDLSLKGSVHWSVRKLKTKIKHGQDKGWLPRSEKDKTKDSPFGGKPEPLGPGRHQDPVLEVRICQKDHEFLMDLARARKVNGANSMMWRLMCEYVQQNLAALEAEVDAERLRRTL
jgi:hypothetical protein